MTLFPKTTYRKWWIPAAGTAAGSLLILGLMLWTPACDTRTAETEVMHKTENKTGPDTNSKDIPWYGTPPPPPPELGQEDQILAQVSDPKAYDQCLRQEAGRFYGKFNLENRPGPAEPVEILTRIAATRCAKEQQPALTEAQRQEKQDRFVEGTVEAAKAMQEAAAQMVKWQNDFGEAVQEIQKGTAEAHPEQP